MDPGEIWGCAPRARSALPGADASPGVLRANTIGNRLYGAAPP